MKGVHRRASEEVPFQVAGTDGSGQQDRICCRYVCRSVGGSAVHPVAIDPEASGPSEIKTETTTSFQGFAPAVKDHTGVDLDSTLHLNSSALQLNVDSASRGPPGLPRTAGAYSADPPSQEASGMKRYSSTDIPKASSSIMGSSQNSELNFGQYSSQPEGNQTIAHAYSLVHDNSQFGVANTSSLETTISPRANQDITYPIPAS